MNYNDIKYFHLLWIIVPILILFFYSENKGKGFGSLPLSSEGTRNGASLLSGPFTKWKKIRLIKLFLYIGGIFFLATALAGPRWGMKEQVIERKGIDIVVAIDLSKSMLTADISPSRIERAKYELSAFIDSRKGDRIGIVAFSGGAVIVCPLTMDYGAAKNLMKGLNAGVLPSQGTDLAGAIELASDMMKNYGGREKIIVLLTDGEDMKGDPLTAAARASKKGASVYTIGFGTEKGGPIPVYGRDGKIKDYKKNRQGNTVISRLDGALLKKIAEKGSGMSFKGAAAISRLTAELEKKDKSVISSKLFTLLEERFQYPLFLAFIFLSFEMLLRPVRKGQ